MVIVVTDSCASVPEPIAVGLGIGVVHYYVHSARGTLRDNLDMSGDEFYAWLKTAPEWPTTANPSAGEYLEVFREASRRGDGVVAVSITGTGSGGFQSALLARRLAETELPGFPIEVVDTAQVAMAHGWAVIQAAREEVEKFRALLEEHYTVIEWVVAQLSPALGVHSGPGTVGIAIIPDAPLG